MDNSNLDKTYTTFDEAIDAVLAEMKATLLRKRHDYGQANIAKFGSLGILVRASDKIERLINLQHKDPELADETVMDTWLDLMGYAILAILWLKGQYGLPTEVSYNRTEDNSTNEVNVSIGQCFFRGNDYPSRLTQD